MIGIGIQGAGLTMAGIGDLDPTPDSPVNLPGVRYIGPDKDYAIDPATSSFAKMGSTKQRVFLAVSTGLNSSCLQDFGVLDPTKVNGQFESAMKNSVRAALRSMTNSGEIRIDDIVIERLNSNRTQRTVHFTDLLTNTKDSVVSFYG
jgi:hypothetical protein